MIKVAERVQKILRMLNSGTGEAANAATALIRLGQQHDLRDLEVRLAGDKGSLWQTLLRASESEIEAHRREIARLEILLQQAEERERRAEKLADTETAKRKRAEAKARARAAASEAKQENLDHLRSDRFSPSRPQSDLIRDIQETAGRREVAAHNLTANHELALGGLVHAILIAAGYCDADGATIRRKRGDNKPTQQAYLTGIIQKPTYQWLLTCRKAYLIVLCSEWNEIWDGTSTLSIEAINAAANAYRRGDKPSKPRRRGLDSQRLSRIRQAIRSRDFDAAIALDINWEEEDAMPEPVK